MSATFKGTVKFFSDEKGYGFIVPDDKGAEVFFHRSGIAGGRDEVFADQRVSYEITKSEKGNKTKAVNVAVI